MNTVLSIIITPELKEKIPLFQNFEDGENFPMTRPFMKEIINDELSLDKMKTSDLEEACISCGYLGLNSKFIVDELIWRDGGEEVSCYFGDNKVSINNIALRNEFLQYYKGEVSLVAQCRRKSPSGSLQLECIIIAGEGNLRLLKYAHENGFPWDESTCSFAAKNGQLDCLKYAHENGCEWNVLTCTYAAANGKLECLKYAHENGCEWDKQIKYTRPNGRFGYLEISNNTCCSSARHGQLECLKYAHENGCPWDKYVSRWVAKKGNLECLKYLHENGCPWDKWTCVSAAKNGHLECLKYAHENGCLWDETVCQYAALYGHLECLKYAHENGCELHKRVYKAAVHGGNVECLNYLIEKGCPTN